MPSEPVLRHWLVSVVQAAGLEGAADIRVPSDAATADTWELVALKTHVSAKDLAALVARHYRLEVADLASTDPHAHKLLPARVARKLQVLALQYTDRTVVVATTDPVGMEAEREISHVSGRSVQFQVAAPADLAAAIDATYPKEEEPTHEPPPPPEERGGPHVLVVDDDADARVLFRRVLTEHGFRVDEAEDGPQALEMLAGEDVYDVVTLDLLMKGMHGLEVLKHIRSRVATAGLPVVVATGSDDPTAEMDLFEAGADDFVVKPVDPPRFVLRIRAVLRRHSTTPAGLDAGGMA